MANSIQQDSRGPDWPLGCVTIVTPGTPVNIMFNVDPNNVNDPSAPVPSGTGTFPALTLPYTPKCQQIIFQALKPGASHGTAANTGNIYIVRKGVGAGTGNRDDQGSIIFTLTPTANLLVFPNGYGLVDSINPYRYFIDGDTAADGCYITLII